MLLYDLNSNANPWGMGSDGAKASRLEAWQAQDAERLRDMYDAYRKDGGLKQEDFAPEYGLHSQSNMGHYLRGRRPLNLRAAIAFARGLGRPIETFSPTIAAQIEEAAPLARAKPKNTHGAAPWPFPTINPDDYRDMDVSDRKAIEQQAVHAVQRHQKTKLIYRKPTIEIETNNMPLDGKTKGR